MARWWRKFCTRQSFNREKRNDLHFNRREDTQSRTSRIAKFDDSDGLELVTLPDPNPAPDELCVRTNSLDNQDLMVITGRLRP